VCGGDVALEVDGPGGVRVIGFPFGSTGTAAGPELPSETILLVEDEPAVRSLFAQALRQAGYRVLEARNGAEALTVFEGSHDQIDLLLTDIRMPFLSGSELAAKLLERKPGLKMLFISGYAAQVEIGPHSALLQKPFVRADLLRAVRGVLDQPVSAA
jgi:CheY-like chemotaxis protein